MRRYIIEFVSASIDEQELVRLIEQCHAVMNLTIVKQELPELVALDDVKKRQETIEARIKAILSDGKLWQRNSILAYFEEKYPDLAVDRALKSLVLAGDIFKPHHGLYERAASRSISRDKSKPRRRPSTHVSYLDMLECLNFPRTVSELSGIQQLTPQRILQMLEEPLASGSVRRIYLRAGGTKRPHYIRADCLDSSDRNSQYRTLAERERVLVSVLAEHRLTPVEEAARFARVTKPAGRFIADRLQEQGLLRIYRMGMHVFVQITPEGLSHPEYTAASRKCVPVRFLDYLGSTRCLLIVLLNRLDVAQSRTLTAALESGPQLACDKTTGAALRLLLNSDLVEKVPRTNSGHAWYALTEKGVMVARHIERFEPALLPLDANIHPAVRDTSA
ncbi:MAG: hypothetical protein AB7F96_09890 [Beijerinckiaceae bacterium]